MSEMELAVLICNKIAGTLRQDSAGLMSFRYEESYDGIPLSLSMPISNRAYRQAVVRPYLFGLLPDSERQRAAIARETDTSPNNPVTLLAHIGLDCPGGVQFCDPSKVDEVLSRQGSWRMLTEHEIAEKLKSIRSDVDASWMGRDGSWSLGGNQGKFALANRGDAWCECLGSSPTTHIFKNGVVGFKLEALNEYVCMRAARKVNIPVATVAYRVFEGEPALIVERYDRLRANGRVLRLHQEDLCQALGVMPQQKYTADGGPTARDVLALLLGLGHAEDNLRLFTQMLFFNCLIGAPDAHAKNYSLLLGKSGDAIMARMYDVASGLAYDRMRDTAKLAMAIGGENRIGRVGNGAVKRYAGEGDPELQSRLCAAGLNEENCLQEMRRLALEIPDAFMEVFAEAKADGVPGAEELEGRLMDPVARNCEATLRLL